MAVKLPKKGGVFIQMEDELASIASVIGAAWTGAGDDRDERPGFFPDDGKYRVRGDDRDPLRYRECTAGRPFYRPADYGGTGGHAAVPVRVAWRLRGNRALPCKRPGNYDLTVKAFNLADRYRVPVFLMADEVIGHMRERILVPDTVERTGRPTFVPGTPPFKPGEGLIPGFPNSVKVTERT